MRFTVLIPTHDNGPVVRGAIESVLAQTLQPIEVFLVCDGAPAETLDVARAMAAQDERIRCFAHDKGERHGEAWRHLALAQATGEAVCYLGDDDYWFPEHLETMSALLAEADFAHTRHVQIERDFKILSPGEALSDEGVPRRMLTEAFNFFGPTVVGHRMDAYRALPEGWAPGPADVWSDLNMWRKWLSMETMRMVSSGAITTMKVERASRKSLDGPVVQNEIEFWREAFHDPHLRRALQAALDETGRTEVALGEVERRARALRATG